MCLGFKANVGHLSSQVGALCDWSPELGAVSHREG